MLTMVLIILTLLVFNYLSGETLPLPPDNYLAPGAGFSSDNPYLINNLAHLRWLSETPEAWGGDLPVYFQQTADIDADETKEWNQGDGFIPIALNSKEIVDGIIVSESSPVFSANFDGNGFSVFNLSINIQQKENLHHVVGFFSHITASNLLNIHLVNLQVYGQEVTGGLVGIAENSTIEFSSTNGKIITNNLVRQVGGIMGMMSNTKLEKSFSSVLISTNHQNLITNNSEIA